jgi:L-threonylcarbamoyladenylate synthase
MKKPEKSKYEELNKAVGVLRRGGVIIFPTDTVYGIGCIWDNSAAIARIRNIKSSMQDFPILIANISQAHAIAKISPQALVLINKYWPGGLTILVKSRKDDKKVGIRMPASDTVKFLIENLGSPIIGTSANFHGQGAPTKSEDIEPRLIKLVDFVVKGECEKGKESTVIDTTLSPAKILRRGAVTIS